MTPPPARRTSSSRVPCAVRRSRAHASFEAPPARSASRSIAMSAPKNGMRRSRNSTERAGSLSVVNRRAPDTRGGEAATKRPSRRRVPAVYREDLPGDVVGGARREVDDRPLEVPATAAPAKRDGAREPLAPPLDARARHAAREPSRRDRHHVEL